MAVVFYIGKFAHQVFSHGLPAMLGLGAAAATGSDRLWTWLLPGIVVLISFGLIGSVLSYLRFRFRIVDDRILVRSGVLHRQELDIEFSRVQNITIKEPFYMRPFGLALLSIDTAGSNKEEVVLGGIAKPLARSLRETILGSVRPQTELEDDATTAQGESGLLLTRSVRDIAIYGLTLNFLLWVAVALGAVFGGYDYSEKFFVWLADQVNFFETAWMAAQSDGGAVMGLLIGIALILAAMVILPATGVLIAVVRHYGYRLMVDGETYRKQSGLLSRHDESLKRHKIQAVVWNQNFVARLFGRINLQLRVASAGSGVESGQLPTGSKAAFLVPAVHRAEAVDLSAEFLPGCQADEVVFSRVNQLRYISKNLLLGWLPPLAAISIGPTILLGWMFLLVLPILLGFGYVILHQIWKKLGYAVVGEYGFVRTGFIGTQTTLFPLFKVQRVDLRQTPAQRRHGLANLTIHLASHSLSIPYIELQDAEKFRDLALFYMESSEQAWY